MAILNITNGLVFQKMNKQVMEIIKNYIDALIKLLMEMSPYLLLGFLFAGILHVFFPVEKINRILGKKNTKSVINASLIGVPLPLCSCGVIPTGISFYKHGASSGPTVSFLISTPQTGLDSILVTYSLIGLPFAVLRVIIAFITGIFGGVLTNIFVSEKKEDTKNSTNNFNNNSNPKKFKRPLTELFKYAFVDFIEDIAKWLLIGLLIAAVITVLIPDDFFTGYIRNDFVGMLIILIASVPLYVCATGSVPIAAVLMLKGLSPGAALVFLMAGPATNAATITVIGNVLGKKTLFYYLFSIITGALLFGLLINNFLPREFFMDFINKFSVHDHEMLPSWIKIFSSIVFSILILYSLFNKYFMKFFRKKQVDDYIATNSVLQNMKEINIVVKGMSCNSCKNTVEDNLKNHSDITSANADIERQIVTLTGENIDLDKVKDTIEGLGYKYEGKLEQ